MPLAVNSSSAPSRGLARDLLPPFACALAALEALAAPKVAVGAVVAVAADCPAVLALIDALPVDASLSVSCSSLATHIPSSCYWLNRRW